MDDETYLAAVRAGLPTRLRAVYDAEVAYLGTPGEVEEVRIQTIDAGRHEDGLPELRVTCTIHDPQDGHAFDHDVARFRFDREARGPLDDYLDRLAWALRYGQGFDDPQRPRDPAALAAASAALPDAQSLWDRMATQPDCAATGPGEVRLCETTVLVTAEQWREIVVDCEVAARTDSGVDVFRPGDGPAMAETDLEELVASTDAAYVVWWRGGLHASSRRELPPV